jgi:hypothetical protein
MTKPRAQYLLATLLGLLAARGLGADDLDPWRGWVVFKQFARQVAEQPDPGVSVQIAPADDDEIRLYFLRQVLQPAAGRLEPVGGVVCEFSFAPRWRAVSNWDAWSFDYPDFDHFVDAVEEHLAFADLVTERPIASDVRWEDA